LLLALSGVALPQGNAEKGGEKDFMITVLPTTQTISAGSTAIYAVVVSSDSFDAGVRLSSLIQSGAAQGISMSLEPSAGRPTFVGRFRVATSTQAQPQTVIFAVMASSEKLVRGTTVSLTIVAPTSGPTPSGPAAVPSQVSTFAIGVSPGVRAVNPGQSTSYQVAVTSIGGFTGNVSLSASQLPAGITATFSPISLTIAGDVGNSTLTVSTTPATLPRSYVLKVVGTSGSVVQTADITLIILGGESLIVTATASATVTGANVTVTITGVVTDRANNPIAGADISIQVVDQNGNPAKVSLRVTDSAGRYSEIFPLPVTGAGIFSVFVTASKGGFRDGRIDTSFVIGQVTAPSIAVRGITIADVNNNAKNNFRLVDTIRIIVNIDNRGADLSGLLWIQLEDPTGIPILIQRLPMKISGTITFGPLDLAGSRLLITPGIYKVTVFVSDKLISEGGRFFTSAVSSFSAS